jgi:hypothetical protein
LRDRALGLRAADPRERCKGGVVKRQAHGDADNDPGAIVAQKTARGCEAETARRHDHGAEGHHIPSAATVDPPADEGRRQARCKKRSRETAIDNIARPAEIVPDRVTEDADQIIGDAPTNELRNAEIKNSPARDQREAALKLAFRLYLNRFFLEERARDKIAAQGEQPNEEQQAKCCCLDLGEDDLPNSHADQGWRGAKH